MSDAFDIIADKITDEVRGILKRVYSQGYSAGLASWRASEEDVEIFEITEGNFNMRTEDNFIKDTIAKWSNVEKDIAYRQLWLPHVTEDVRAHMTDYLDKDQYLSDDNIEKIANRYVYEGRYDCNLSYWQNIENLIDEELNRKSYR